MASQGLASQSGQRLAALPIFLRWSAVLGQPCLTRTRRWRRVPLPGESLEGYSGQPVTLTRRLRRVLCRESLERCTGWRWRASVARPPGIRHGTTCGGPAEIKDLCEDVKPGVLPIKLLEVLSKSSCGKYNKAPRIKFQMLENQNIFLAQLKVSPAVARFEPSAP